MFPAMLQCCFKEVYIDHNNKNYTVIQPQHYTTEFFLQPRFSDNRTQIEVS